MAPYRQLAVVFRWQEECTRRDVWTVLGLPMWSLMSHFRYRTSDMHDGHHAHASSLYGLCDALHSTQSQMTSRLHLYVAHGYRVVSRCPVHGQLSAGIPSRLLLMDPDVGPVISA